MRSSLKLLRYREQQRQQQRQATGDNRHRSSMSPAIYRRGRAIELGVRSKGSGEQIHEKLLLPPHWQ
jgi:hypothetical protein